MEANEAQELQEHAEHGAHEQSMRPVALTMTFLAVLVAVVTVLGHRADTAAILNQAKASDTWNEYQARKNRAYDTGLADEHLSVVTLADKDKAGKIVKSHADHQAKSAKDMEDAKAQAEGFEAKVELAEARADRYDLAEALLEIGLVITSVTLLTRIRLYWFLGLGFAAAGVAAAAMGVLLK